MMAAALLTVSALAGCGGARNGEVEVKLGFERYTLANGLTVILRKDDRLPIVAVNLWYHVGPANEVPGRTGFAHLFEHMMFGGSGHDPQARASYLLAAAGATGVDANTDLDRTEYHETVPANALELALWRESDRMGFLLDTLDQAQLSNKQSVVRNERREVNEAPPYALTNEAVNHQLFPPGHPYYGNVIGSHTDIQSARLGDVRDFFTRYYVPNNASLAIVGNLDIAATKAMIEKYFGTIRRGADVPAPQVLTPPLTAEKRITLTDGIQQPIVTMAWLTPRAYAPGDAEADVTAHLLGGGKASRLYEALVHRSGIAQDVSASQQSLSLGSMFTIQATATPGHTAQEMEAAIQHELDALKADGPRPEELAAAKTVIRSDKLFAVQSPSDVADLFNNYNHYLGDPGYLDQDLRRHADVRADAVRRFAVEQLADNRRLVIHTVPGPKVLPPDPPAPPAPSDGAPPAPSSVEAWRNAVPRPGPQVAAALPTAQHVQLANGLAVYLVESHAVPVVSAALNTRWGSASDPPGQAGLAGFANAMLDQGTPTRDASGIARAIDALGAHLSLQAGDDGSSIGVSALTSQASQAMNVMSDLARNPAFPPAQVERVRQQRLVDLRGDTGDTIADEVMRREVYGGNHPYSHPAIGTEQGLRAISRDDLVTFQRRAFSPSTSALVLAGDLTLDQARTLAEDAFGGWTGTGRDTARPGPPTPTADRVLVVDQPGAAQTALVLAQPGVARDDPDYEKLLVLNDLLEGAVNGNLRQTHGYAYGAFSHLGDDRGVSTISLSTDVQTRFTGPSVHEMLGEVSRIQDEPVDPENLNKAKESVIGSLPTDFVTVNDSAAAIGQLYLDDQPPDYYQTLPARVATITAGDLQAVARAHLRPQQMKVIAVGDRSTIEPQLSALGLGPVVHLNPDGTPVP